MDIIQSLWVGPSLSKLEQLSVASFLANGHPFHLYVYDKVENIPKGTVVLDANEIMPPPKPGTVLAAFADLFRYKMLYEKGGWWVDTDTICLKPFTFPDSPILAGKQSDGEIANGVIRMLDKNVAMKLCEKANQIGVNCSWGETGPRLLTKIISEENLLQYVLPKNIFYPFPVCKISYLLEPRREIPEDAYALHGYNEIWRREKRNKNGKYHPTSVFERLKRKYL